MGKKNYFLAFPWYLLLIFGTYTHWISPYWSYMGKKFWKWKNTIEWVWVPFLKIIILQDMAKLWKEKKNSRVPYFCQKFSKMWLLGANSDFIPSNMMVILSLMSRDLHGYPSNMCWVNLKQLFWPFQICAFQWYFFPMLILVGGAIFSAPNSSTPNWLDIQGEKIAWFHSQKLTTRQIHQLSIWASQIWKQIVGLILS